ncbi:hypothetical protein [Roseateles asaccharophilus]|uniref:Uncharacterized protein n=1 Tax=Roseateles asaccharophilus TaxID=582607 RepID=A0ABU2A7K7_9BURK|nr:hypothetical protein [Roseateles asaccharophilus]MDR7333184.1 hypothetical protein [Roseateles asaccharophilus]
MKRLFLLSLLLPALACAAPPAVQLLVELRWVDSALPPSAQAGVRDGAVVVGTAGTVSPRGPGVVTSTVPAVSVPTQRLLVQNGERASARLTSREPLQWVETTVELNPAGATRRIYANPRPQERQVAQSFMVTPTWAGGDAPVRVTFDVEDAGNAYQSTLSLPMNRWQAAARVGGSTAPAPRGTVSSRDAAGRPERELQLRVSIQY